ncbi:dnaJ homolog subfamily B member 7 [Thomomys bottae]
MVDYYELLGVQRYASSEDIKKAYHKVALKWHPDKNPENKEEAEKKFKEVAEAYEVLSNDEKRVIYDKYGKKGLDGGGRSHFDNECEDSFTFHKTDDVFKEFFGERDPFSFHFFEDSLQDLLNSPRHTCGRSRGTGSFFPTSSEQPVYQRFSSYDTGYTSYGSLGHEGFTASSSRTFDDSEMGRYIPVTTSGKIVNGRSISTNKIIDYGQETEVEDDGELKSFLMNSVADEEGFVQRNWRRQPFNHYPSNSYSPKHVSPFTFVDNHQQGIPWVTSNWDPSILSAGFKEGSKRKKKKHKEGQKKKSTRRNR